MFGLQDKRFLEFIENEFIAYEILVSNLENKLSLAKKTSTDDLKIYDALVIDLIEAQKAFEIISEVAYKYKIFNKVKFNSPSLIKYFSK